MMTFLLFQKKNTGGKGYLRTSAYLETVKQRNICSDNIYYSGSVYDKYLEFLLIMNKNTSVFPTI